MGDTSPSGSYTLARLARIPCLVNLAGKFEKFTPKVSSLLSQGTPRSLPLICRCERAAKLLFGKGRLVVLTVSFKFRFVGVSFVQLELSINKNLCGFAFQLLCCWYRRHTSNKVIDVKTL